MISKFLKTIVLKSLFTKYIYRHIVDDMQKGEKFEKFNKQFEIDVK